jgi:hypothetical protein
MITNDHQSSIIPGYFEMDCALTGLRGGDRRVDEAVLALANFPVGNAGEPGTPHEFLVADTVPLPDPLACSDSSSSRSKNKNNRREGRSPWMLKLKSGDPVDAEAYRAFLQEVRRSHATPAAAKTAAARIPRVIWMYWAQGEGDESMTRRDRLCVEGWRALNERRSNGEEEVEGRGWEVRLLDDESSKLWAAPVVRLWGEGTPDGAKLPQHRADLLRAFLLAAYGGVWADASVSELYYSLLAYLLACLCRPWW